MKKLIVILLFVVVIFSGCDLVTQSINSLLNSTGSLSISLNEPTSRIILPDDFPLDVDYYKIFGSGPDGATVYPITFSGSATVINDLVVGDWTINVEAYNQYDELIGVGNTTATVLSNQTVNASVDLSVLDGTGTLDIEISWPDTIPPNNLSMTGSITDIDGVTSDITLAISDHSVSYTESLDAGFYILSLTLYNSSDIIWGESYSVLVVKDQITTCSTSLSIDAINLLVGSMQMRITNQITPDYSVEISGNELLVPGAIVSLEASPVNHLDYQTIRDFSYQWYIQGQLIEGQTNSTLTLEADEFELGKYSVSVYAKGDRMYQVGTTIIEVGYTVGMTGPAGGKIFYKGPLEGYTNTAYLELAPSTWSDTGYSTKGIYGTNGVMIGGTYNTLGSGKRNTSLALAVIEDRGETETAAQLIDALEISVNDKLFDDWFIPSINELYKIFRNLGEDIDFDMFTYISSSEYDCGTMDGNIPGVSATPTGSSRLSKNTAYRFLPVRSFNSLK